MPRKKSSLMLRLRAKALKNMYTLELWKILLNDRARPGRNIDQQQKEISHNLSHSPEHSVGQGSERVSQLGNACPELGHSVVGEHGVDVAHVVTLPQFVHRHLGSVAFLN